jgi:hypothetical protein
MYLLVIFTFPPTILHRESLKTRAVFFASGRIFWLNWQKMFRISWQHCPYRAVRSRYSLSVTHSEFGLHHAWLLCNSVYIRKSIRHIGVLFRQIPRMSMDVWKYSYSSCLSLKPASSSPQSVISDISLASTLSTSPIYRHQNPPDFFSRMNTLRLQPS